MYKRTLMLTAAAVALLSGPANAAPTTGCDSSNSENYTDITKQITIPLCTKYANKGSAGKITFEANGSLSINSTVSTNGTIPALEINSSNGIVTFDSGSSLTFTDVGDAVGIRMDQGASGELINDGSWDISGNGSTKVGILIGNPNNATGGTFTGVVDGTNNTVAPTDKTAVVLGSGSTIKVQGDGSFGLELLPSDNLVGDIFVDGSLVAEVTDLNSTSTTSGVTGVYLAGNMTGNLIVNASAAISSIGAGAEGVVLTGDMDGYIENLGAIGSVGIVTPQTGKANPVSGTDLAISGNVTKGIFNGGPVSANDGTAIATLVSDGSSATVLIAPGFNNSSAKPIVIGTFHDTGGLGDFSFINRGDVTSSPYDPNTSSLAIAIAGASSTNTVTMTGILNTGAISATATNNVSQASGSVTTATALDIATNATVNTVGGYAITNSNAAGSGTISASVGGAESAAAYAIEIGPNSTVSSLNNSGTIRAVVTTTDVTNDSLSAFAIVDQSGTLLNIDNSGTISAVANATVNGTFVALNNHQNIANAIFLGAATQNISIDNSGNIIGNIDLGSGDDLLKVDGTNSAAANVTGNMNFGGGNDTLEVDHFAGVTGDLLETAGSYLNITVATQGSLTATNNGSTTNGLAIPAGINNNIQVSNLTVEDGGTLGVTLADPYNYAKSSSAVPIIQADLNSQSLGSIQLNSGAVLKMNFGGYISTTSLSKGSNAEFVLFDAAKGKLTIANPSQIETYIQNNIPWLFTGSACAYNVSGFTKCTPALGSDPAGANHSSLVVSLAAKNPTLSTSKGGLGLTGYAANMFVAANTALAGDTALGAAVINAGAPVQTNSGIQPLTDVEGQALYQKIYSAFAPDVTGSERAIAISLSDQGTGIVGARQRALNMYAGQDGDMTLWGQEFGQRLNVPNEVSAGGYSNTGFGFAMGADGGDIQSGRYGAALTFYTGDTREKSPRLSKTTSEWYMLTGYQNWRGRGLFFDSQINIGYGNLDGRRSFPIPDANGATRVAEGKRAAEMASGGFTTGVIFNSGGTVIIPQLSVDGLTMRQESYTESGGGPGMDLHVGSTYANSLRAFLGADLRQDLKFGSYYLQPEVRVGYRYDFLSGAEKLKVNFAGDPNTTPVVAPGNQFTITGPDPAKGNLNLGGGLAITTDAWSIGFNYDYLRGMGGTKGVNQTGMLTLIGRI